MAYALQQLVNGVTLGMIYGLIAIGYTMVYGIIGMINFAHGDVFMVGAFIGIEGFTAPDSLSYIRLFWGVVRSIMFNDFNELYASAASRSGG